MAGRRTNLALLWSVVLALLTGIGAFLVGTDSWRWVVIAHGLIALSIVVLAPWKSIVAARGLRRPRGGRGTSVVLTLTTLLTLVSGVVLVSGGAEKLLVFTPMQVHVSSGLLTVALTLIHTLQHPTPHRRPDLNRRNALRATGVLATAGFVWFGLEWILDALGSRGGVRRFTGSHEITDPKQIPATQWLDDRVPHLDPESHEVSVVGRPHSVDELAGQGDVVRATLDCTGGWYTTQEWAGTRLSRLLGDVVGTSIVVLSVTGYWRRFPFDQADSLYLVTHMAGKPLPHGNGGPVRIVAPGRRGYWWVKWVRSVEVDDSPSWWQPPLPMA